jgi:hypothetical protein
MIATIISSHACLINLIHRLYCYGWVMINDACVTSDGTRTTRLRMVAMALVNKAIGGDISTIRGIVDRLD